MGRFSSLELWLQQHGAAVEQLNIAEEGYNKPQLLLPFALMQQRLQSLRVYGCKLLDGLEEASMLSRTDRKRPQLGSSGEQHRGSSSSLASLSSLTKLTALQLESVRLFLRGGLAGLSSLTKLQKLQLRDCYLSELPELDIFEQHEDHALRSYQRQQDQIQRQVLGSLTLLTQLTSLALGGTCLPPADAVAPFSRLQQLQELSVAAEAPSQLAALPCSLTKLDVGYHSTKILSGSSAQGLGALTALQQLRLLCH
jgi:Leucine-rich repeat (LRR) protein